MVDWATTFIDTGLLVIEDALAPDFCEHVVAERLASIGVDETDRRTWRTGWHNLPATTTYRMSEVAPVAADAMELLVGGSDAVAFGDLPDNLIVNFPDPASSWWSPHERHNDASAGWHKDGDWFRHFLDSPEQALLGIVFWRDVTERQGATYVVMGSVAPVAQLLRTHPEGIDPSVPVGEIVADARDVRALTARQGTIVWAHPFLVHTKSVNATDRLRIISNTSVMLRQPLRFDGGRSHTPLERSILRALGAPHLDYRITRQRERFTPERERRWKRVHDERRTQTG